MSGLELGREVMGDDSGPGQELKGKENGEERGGLVSTLSPVCVNPRDR